jgi:hypothetical protein
MSIWIVAACVLSYWVAQLGVMLVKMEGAAPLMAITQIVSGGRSWSSSSWTPRSGSAPRTE